MTSDFLFDTNVIVYAFDNDEPDKRKKAMPIIEDVFEDRLVGFISNQIMAELYHVLTRKQRVSKQTAASIISDIISCPSWVKIDYKADTVSKAIFISSSFSMSFWDSLIAATMLENNITKIYTENTKDFRKIPGIQPTNPFI